MGRLVEKEELRDKFQVFSDRSEAGRKLAEFLEEKGIRGDIVLAIPNGGVAVGAEVALGLEVELRVAVVRKLVFPWNPEAGFGALSWTGELIVDERIKEYLTEEEYEYSLRRAERSVREREKLFKDFLPPETLEGMRVILVDDGLATGYTMLVAVRSVKGLRARKVVVAVPTSPRSAVEMLLKEVDTIAVLNLRSTIPFAVADAYKFWRDLSEMEILNILLSLRNLGL